MVITTKGCRLADTAIDFDGTGACAEEDEGRDRLERLSRAVLAALVLVTTLRGMGFGWFTAVSVPLLSVSLLQEG